MKHIFFILFTLTLGTAYSQLPTRLKLKQLEQGTPGQTIVVDSLGNATYGSGTADGNGIYNGSGSTPIGTLVSISQDEVAFDTASFGIGSLNSWPVGFDEDAGINKGIYITATEVGMVNELAGLNINNDDLVLWVNKSDGGNQRFASLSLSSSVGASNSQFTLATSADIYGRTASIQSDLTNATASGYLFGAYSEAARGIYIGFGTPEGVISAPPGSLYLRTAGGAGTSLYVKESGTGNTGWVGK